jgi:hypothetical protein
MLRLGLEHHANGGSVAADEWRDAMARYALNKALKRVRATVDWVVCDVHERSAILRCEVPSGTDDVNFSYSFCCEALRVKLERLLT